MNKKRNTAGIIIICGIVLLGIAAAVFALLPADKPEKCAERMLQAVNDMDFEKYRGTLHPVLLSELDAVGDGDVYMASLKKELLAGCTAGAELKFNFYTSEDYTAEDVQLLREQFTGIEGFDITDACLVYFYCAEYNGTPELLDSAVTVKSSGKWYMLT